MKARPTIFLSGVSHEFGSFRDAVEIEIQKKGCFTENQSSFAPAYHTVEEMLRRKLKDSDAVIHIVGFRFGAEPNQRPADKPRRSYTQMEFDIAREMQKPVFVFLSTDSSVRDPAKPDEKPENTETVTLQQAHQQAVQNTNHLYYFFKDKADLCKLVADIPVLAHAGEFKADISRILKYAPAELIGRKDELKLLNDAWAKVRNAELPRPRVLTFVALGGEGKTSLVAKWAAELAHQDWPGCDAAFAWSFYSQGTREQLASSSDLFLKEALAFFGDESMAGSAAGAFEKGRRLVQLVGQRRCLLILDGLEPLQYAPTAPTPGELKDQGVAALLKGLAAASQGLCVVTTRYSIPDLRVFWQTTAPEVKLLRLSRDAGVHLLKTLGVIGTAKEFEMLVEDLKGHALTLTLLGSYLRDAHAGDIRRRDRVKLEEADALEQGGHAFHVMTAYERALECEGDQGQRALAVLRLLGLFDRPMTADCLGALLKEPPIPGLTDPLVGLPEAQLNIALSRLESAKLLTVHRDHSALQPFAFSLQPSLDAHPLLREYFARQLRVRQPDSWLAAHRRLFEHLQASVPYLPEGLDGLQPLYQAITHGCQAEQYQRAFEVYEKRIQRGKSGPGANYSTMKLGLISSNLATAACFFVKCWGLPVSGLKLEEQARVLNIAGFNLHGVSQLNEAQEPMSNSVRISEALADWKEAAISAGGLSELELALGDIRAAVNAAAQSVVFADKRGEDDWHTYIRTRTIQASVLQQAGRVEESQELFALAEAMQKKRGGEFPLLHSLPGFRYCDFRLAEVEPAAWRCTLECGGSSLGKESLNAIKHHATQTLKWVTQLDWRLAIALDHLTLARTALYGTLLDHSSFDIPKSQLNSHFDAALRGLRQASQLNYLPHGLLARAWLRSLTDARTGPESAQSDLNEAWEIAERGPMRLHMADIHLYRPRLFFREKPYPWKSPQEDLAAAEKLINECGYHRRDEELADVKGAILSSSEIDSP